MERPSMFWDGSGWVQDPADPTPPPRRPKRPTKSSRARDWLATGVMILAVVALVVPMVGVSAARPPAKSLVKDWSASYELTTVQETSKRLKYSGRWQRVDHDAYLGDHARASD